MNAQELLKAIQPLVNSPVKNYVIPGLTSSLVGGVGNGTVRLFTCERTHEEPICPHSHRFSFTCFVLAGAVRNRIWRRAYSGDQYEALRLIKTGQFGAYEKSIGERGRYAFNELSYGPGEMYSMKHDEIHSIYFSAGASVLFFEGPEVQNESLVLQPVVDGETVPTFRVESWMFQKEQK